MYYDISRYYGLPLWSSKQMLWSEFAMAHQRHFVNWLLQYGTHPDFSYHLFFADLLSLGFITSLSKCGEESHYKTYSDLPSLHIESHNKHEGVCNPSKSPRLEEFPTSSFVPEDLVEFESKLTGWTEFVDHHNVPGFIINNFAKDTVLSFPLEYSQFTDLEGDIIKVIYLKTYHNAGSFQISLCGQTLEGVIDTLHRHHISIPAVYTVLLDRPTITPCENVPLSERSVQIIYKAHFGSDGADHGSPRVHEKVKVLSVQICSRNQAH